jgi:beta-galactosidase
MKKAALLILCALAVTGLVFAKKTAPAGKSTGPRTVLLINCGAVSNYTDTQGRVWQADRQYKEGEWGAVAGEAVARSDIDIKNTEDDAIYLHERYSMEAYRIPLPKGVYTVRLHFAECYDGIWQDGQRVFTVLIEGKEVLKSFDVFKEAADYNPVVKEFKVKVKDGELTIGFKADVQNPLINGIEIIQ